MLGFCLSLSVLADEGYDGSSSTWKQSQSVLLKVGVVMMPLILEIGVSGAFLGLKIVLSFCFGIWVLVYRYIQFLKKE